VSVEGAGARVTRTARGRAKYDISVKKNHNYMAGTKEGGVIVHNSPETEPGGQALKFFSDVRFRFFPRALSGAPYNPKGEGQLEKEPSLTYPGGEDHYRYIHVSAAKNKLSPPGRQTWLRIWVQDGNGDAQGYDPVFDTFHYLMQTGQASGKKSAVKLNVAGLGEATKSITWLEFKTLVLGSKALREPVCDKIGYRNIDLRKGCFAQIKKGKSEAMYLAQNKAALSKKATDDEDD
jgi:RecA/RadA recombinase